MQVLRAVVETGSVTAAAGRLGYTPSAVSQQVTALEAQAGTPLLERVGRGVRPTEAGTLLAGHAELIGGQVALAEAALADLRAGRTGRLTVRYFATAGPGLLAPALARFRDQHPGVGVELRLSEPDDPLAEVAEGRADLGLGVRPDAPPPPGVDLVRLLDDPYRVALPPDHPLAGREVVDLADLAEEPWIGSEPPGPCLHAVLQGCAAAGFTPEVAVECQDYTTAQGFVAAGLGVALLPRLGLAVPHPGVTVRPVRGPEPARTIRAALRSGAPRTPALTGLLTALREAAGPLGGSFSAHSYGS
ncbi:LysR family transcriptional regulator [Streptomyces albidoflavus]|uniref:LysR family transcriptional regulator n=1 Tax=Streptomyces albidoflavus TaxID=1886 RepID=UPI00101FE9D8|nr:LysR family transcriptional regulator [Streptomyces albidoflavus]RZD55623.1 LysR family transcriptional regulator [Streptomyces albidoflavus]